MSRRKSIKYSVWIRTPHADYPPPSLWWYTPPSLWSDDLRSFEKSRHVLLVYLEQRAFKFDREGRGSSTESRWEAVRRALEIQARDGAVPSNFPENLERWLHELIEPDLRTGRYWTLPGYALAHQIKPHPFCAWFRRMEKVAKELYPDRMPLGRADNPPTEETIQSIRAEYLQTGDAKKIAAKYFGSEDESWRVGQLCRKEKQERSERMQAEQRAASASESATSESHSVLDEEDPFLDPFLKIG